MNKKKKCQINKELKKNDVKICEIIKAYVA